MGILRGDVTPSTDAVVDAATTVLAQVGAINTLYHMGVFNPTMTAEATAGSGTYTAAATVTGAETIKLGASTGIHVIEDMEDVDTILMDDANYKIAVDTGCVSANGCY